MLYMIMFSGKVAVIGGCHGTVALFILRSLYLEKKSYHLNFHHLKLSLKLSLPIFHIMSFRVQIFFYVIGGGGGGVPHLFH